MRTVTASAALAVVALLVGPAPARAAWAASDPAVPVFAVDSADSADVPSMTAELSRPAVRVGRPVVVTGIVTGLADVPVQLERKLDGHWRQVDATEPGPDGAFSFRLVPDQPGWVRLRVHRPATAETPGTVVGLPTLDVFRMHSYTVRTRGTVSVQRSVFRADVAEIYDDPRGWLQSHHRFREVTSHGDFTVVLANQSLLPAYSGTCSTSYSCRVGRFVVLNQTRWRLGSPYFPANRTTYRRMVLDHETGHWLGLGHASCPARGAPAPVMQQQSKGMQGCRPNPWPRPREIRRVS